MNKIAKMLSGGDLRSDGMANEVVRLIGENPFLVNELIDCLTEKDAVIRGRSADVLEKLTRDHPEFVRSEVNTIYQLVLNDPLPMVRWHAAMILTYLVTVDNVDQVYSVLTAVLEDRSAIVKCWAISGLCYLGRKWLSRKKQILQLLAGLDTHPSIAVRHRAATAMKVLMDDRLPMPAGWIKNQPKR